MDEPQIIAALVAQQENLDFSMVVKGLEYHVESFSVSYSETPVTKPTMRGGVYFSHSKEFKIRAKLADASLSSVLSGTMLGPNTDFEKIKFLTALDVNGEKKRLTVFANLTNYAQKGGGLELNLVVVGAELSD